MEKRYKEIDGVKYQVIQNTILGSNVVPVGETLPEVTTSDNGKLLGVSSGEWTPVEAPSGLPDITGNAGKVLKVNAGATGTEWANETTELPAVTAADEGDVLTVNASGEWEAAAPGGGGAVYITETISGNDHTLSKNYNEIMAYIEAGNIVFLKEEPETGTYYCPLVGNAVLGGVMHAISFEYYDTSDQTPTKRFVNFMGMSATGALTYTETS